ncbi:MAG TPA: WD40 repeat domain-containing protein [Vicinamibacterales bacterium]|nr:WD40 repeat domain-containing protein [Vicinamibacterales bacterium]
MHPFQLWRRPFRAAVLLGATLLSAITLHAAPGFWQAATQADFLRGDVDQLSIDEHGRVTLGPELTRVHDAAAPFVWAIVAGADGSWFLGTGNDGKVIRVDRNGQGAVFFDSTELEVHALASAPNGDLYVGTSPDGRVYRVDAKAQATTFFDPDDKYIWSLVVDRAGNVFAGTGDKGTIYKITPDGKGQRFFSTKTAHAVSLAFDPNGHLLTGTGTPGRVFRIDPAGKGFLLLDTTYQEIHAIRVDPKGVVYAAAQSGRAQSGNESLTDTVSTPPPVTPSIPNVSTEITSIAVVDVGSPPSGGSSSSADRRNTMTGAVFRIQPDGLWDEMWSARDDAPYDIAIEDDGAVLVATGAKGKLFRLTGNPVNPVLVTRVPAQQATMIARTAERTFITTANPGLLVSIASTRATRGTFESDVKDARLVSTWGVVSWRAQTPPGTKVEVFTRSGNTRTPDEAWSEWHGPYTNAEGSQIASPKARYLQWRAVLTGTAAAAPTLTALSSAYLPRNIRPQVASITVHPPGVVFQKPFSSGETEIAGLDEEAQDRRAAANNAGAGAPQLGRKIFQRGLQTFQWKAEDDNNDELSYDVSYRREGETAWRLLKSDLRDTLLVWDTSSVPNGTYVLKVSASDRRSNPPEAALVGEAESSSFEIDNVAPIVQIAAVRRDGTRFIVPADVRDGDSAVAKVEYSIDAQRWQPVFPRDGILDARSETFEIRLDADAAGRTLVIRATDALGNVGTGQVRIR